MKATNHQHLALQNTVEAWARDYVVGLNLCPFAKKVLQQKRIRFRVCDGVSREALLEQLAVELDFLDNSSDAETSVLIFSDALTEYDDYLDFLELANLLLADLNFEGDLQLASFHPRYRFANTTADAAENYTNRSPLPLLHILREADVAKAIASHPNVADIPTKNIQLMIEKGTQQLSKILRSFQ